VTAWSRTLHRWVTTPPRPGRLERYARYGWFQKCTATGRALLLLLLVAGMGGTLVGYNGPLYYFPVFLFSFLLVGRLGGLFFAPRVELQRRLPERCAAGATITVAARAHNRGRLPVYDLAASEKRPPLAIRLEEQPEYLDRLEPGGTAELRYRLTPQRRGAYDLPGPVALSAFPFGVYHSLRETDDPHRLLVYPPFAPLAAIDLPVGRKHQPGGLQLVSRVGDSEEYMGDREYRSGDRLRDLDHRAWARVGHPVVREYRQEYLCRVALVLDTHISTRLTRWGLQTFDPVRRRRRQDLEAAVSFAASVADCLSRQEYVIDLFAAGPELYHLEAGRSLAYLDNILDVLACLEPCRENPFATLGPAIAEEIERISTAVVVLLDWDETRERFVRDLRDCGVAVKLVIVREEAPTRDPSGFSGEAGPAQVLRPAQVRKGVGRL
jgi:uncharacterized protein (DUF58 family)